MIAVLGPGGVGGLLAALLDRAGEPVVLVAREPTASTLADIGVTVRSERFGEWTARPRIVTELHEPVDVLVVATKAIGLEDALERIETGAPGLVVPLLNGLEHMTPLRTRYGDRAAAGSVRVDSDRPRVGYVVHSSPTMRVEAAHNDPARRPALEAFGARLARTGVDTTVGDSEAEVLWTKLARLCAIACTTTAFDATVGELRRPGTEGRAALEGCVAETVAVARAEGAAIDAAATMAELERVHPGLGSSMRRDVAAGRTPELDAIAGAVMRAGARHGIATPTVAALAARIADRAGIAAPRP